jgi:hypothetical protein
MGKMVEENLKTRGGELSIISVKQARQDKVFTEISKVRVFKIENDVL